jgi:hypothetical protein
MNEPRDSPQRRKQFLVICTIMASIFAYSFVKAGGLTAVVASQGRFPGGEFAYKYVVRDYATSMSLMETIGAEINIQRADMADQLYSMYLDAGGLWVSGDRQRFASGHLATDKAGKLKNRQLLKTNSAATTKTNSPVNNDPSVQDLWKRLEYKTAQLPAAKALIVQFPYTDGFVSALMLSLKVIPRLRALAAASTKEPIVVISTCSAPDQMCTHYVPLEKTNAFLLGQPSHEKYLVEAGVDKGPVDWDGVRRTFTTPLVWLGIMNKPVQSATTDEL